MFKNIFLMTMFTVAFFNTCEAYYTEADQSIIEAMEYAKKGDYKAAIEKYNFVISDTLVNRANAQKELKNIEQAWKDLELAEQFNPRESRVYLTRGNFYRDLGEPQKAIEQYSKAIEINDRFMVWAYNNRGRVFGSLGDFEQALNDLNKSAVIQSQLMRFSSVRVSSSTGWSSEMPEIFSSCENAAMSGTRMLIISTVAAGAGLSLAGSRNSRPGMNKVGTGSSEILAAPFSVTWRLVWF